MNLPQNYSELLERCNGTFIPKSVDDFIGEQTLQSGSGARAVANLIDNTVQIAKSQNNAPVKFLLNGRPGLGKSALAFFVKHSLRCDKWSTQRFNGTQVKIELVEQLANSLAYKSLYNDYQLIQIDEADEIPRVAQVRLLTLLDDLPHGAAIICTSNCKVKDFEERFQTRFQVFDLLGPLPHEIESLLLRYTNNAAAAKQIANLACGNVRQALLDVKGLIDGCAMQQPLLKAA